MRAYSRRGIRFTQSTGSFGHEPNAHNTCATGRLSYFLVFLFSYFRIALGFGRPFCLLFFSSFFLSFLFLIVFFISFCCGWCRFLDFFIPPNRTASAGRRCTKSRIESITSSISVHHPITFRRVDVISLRVGLYITNEEERKSRRKRERERKLARSMMAVQPTRCNRYRIILLPFFSCLDIFP